MEVINDPMDSRWGEVCRQDVQDMIGDSGKKRAERSSDAAKSVGRIAAYAGGFEKPEEVAIDLDSFRANLPA